MISNKRTIALISILVVVLVWGSAFTVSKVGVQELPPLFLALMRNALATLVLVTFLSGSAEKGCQTGSGAQPSLGKIIVLGTYRRYIFLCILQYFSSPIPAPRWAR